MKTYLEKTYIIFDRELRGYFRTPLASIIGFIETIKGHAKSDKENRELFLSLMHDQAIRMQRLVDDLLSLSKLELQEKSPPLKTCNVKKIINKITESFLPLAKKYKVKLTTREIRTLDKKGVNLL